MELIQRKSKCLAVRSREHRVWGFRDEVKTKQQDDNSKEKKEKNKEADWMERWDKDLKQKKIKDLLWLRLKMEVDLRW